MKQGVLANDKFLDFVDLMEGAQAFEGCRISPERAALGMLEGLIHWIEKSPKIHDGGIGRASDRSICRAMGWGGDPAVVITALFESRWIVKHPDPDIRFYLKSYSQHAVDFIHKRLAENVRTFADGSFPKLTKLSKPRRVEIIQTYLTFGLEYYRYEGAEIHVFDADGQILPLLKAKDLAARAHKSAQMRLYPTPKPMPIPVSGLGSSGSVRGEPLPVDNSGPLGSVQESRGEDPDPGPAASQLPAPLQIPEIDCWFQDDPDPAPSGLPEPVPEPVPESLPVDPQPDASRLPEPLPEPAAVDPDSVSSVPEKPPNPANSGPEKTQPGKNDEGDPVRSRDRIPENVEVFVIDLETWGWCCDCADWIENANRLDGPLRGGAGESRAGCVARLADWWCNHEREAWPDLLEIFKWLGTSSDPEAQRICKALRAWPNAVLPGKGSDRPSSKSRPFCRVEEAQRAMAKNRKLGKGPYEQTLSDARRKRSAGGSGFPRLSRNVGAVNYGDD